MSLWFQCLMYWDEVAFASSNHACMQCTRQHYQLSYQPPHALFRHLLPNAFSPLMSAEHEPGTRLPQVPGSTPSLADLPVDCAFAPRCPKAGPACTTTPPVQHFEDGRTALCHYPIEPVPCQPQHAYGKGRWPGRRDQLRQACSQAASRRHLHRHPPARAVPRAVTSTLAR